MADLDKPNILVIWGDDIGITNLSCYSDGLMGYRTPDIDRIAAEGITFLAAAGDPGIVEKLKAGHAIGDMTYRVHIDGYDLLPYLTGRADKGPRPGFVYFSDDGDLVARRYDNFKLVFLEQRVPGTLQVWAGPFVVLRVPQMFDLRTDPFERADTTSNTYWDFLLEHEYIALAAQSIGMFLETLREFPRQKTASFTIDQAMEKLEAAMTAHR